MSEEPSTAMDEVCGVCGLTFGSHRSGPAPFIDQCPAHEDRMDWPVVPTYFLPTGTVQRVEFGTPSKVRTS